MISCIFFSAALMCSGQSLVQRLRVGSGKEQYRTYDEYMEVIDEMLKENPEYLRKEEIGKSVEGRSLFVLLFGHTTSTLPQEEVLVTAGAHPMEAISPLSALDFLAKMLASVKAGDVEALYLTQRRLVVIHPFVNPDGVVAMDKGGSEIRKNRASVCTTGGQQGVDISLNFPFGPESMQSYLNIGASRECSNTYGGAATFDQPEAKAIKELVEKHKFALALSVHTNGRRIVYPDDTTAEHERFFREHGNASNSRDLGPVQRMQRSQVHPSTGGMLNWLYKQGVLATAIEAADAFLTTHGRKEPVLSSMRGYFGFLVTKAGCDLLVYNTGIDMQVENTGRGKCHKLRVLVHTSSNPIIVDVGDLEAGQKKIAVGSGTNDVNACIQETDVPFCACNVTEDLRTQWFRAEDPICGGTKPPLSTTTAITEEQDEDSYRLLAIAGSILLLPVLVWVCHQCTRKPKKKKRPHASTQRKATNHRNRPGRTNPKAVPRPKRANSAGRRRCA